jgi:pimeloyl-ACP methyl ester carboxylesterase
MRAWQVGLQDFAMYRHPTLSRLPLYRRMLQVAAFQIGASQIFGFQIFGAILLLLGSSGGQAAAQTDYTIELRNGMRLGPGPVSGTDSLSTNSFQQGGSGQNKSQVIGMLDDGLRVTYFNNSARNVLQAQPANASRLEQIELPAAAAVTKFGGAPSSFFTLEITDFNKYGHRTHSIMTPRGQVDLLQAITLLTPNYAKVEVLFSKNKYVWDSRIALSSIPPDQLRSILQQALDLTKSSEWLRLTSFYLQAERYGDARDTMAEALQRFPTELAGRSGVLGQTVQQLANQMFDEIKLRRNAGQHKLAGQLLSSFPVASLPLETQVKLSDDLEALKQQVLLIAEITRSLDEIFAKLTAAEQQTVADIVREIKDEVNFDSVVRLADFQRLRNDASMAADNLMSLAVGGWLLGPGSGVENFAVAQSLLRVRVKTREYLNEASAQRREAILQELSGEEGAQPELLAKLLANMKPPRDLPVPQADDPSGLFRLSVEVQGGTVEYVVQVPPEYDPNRKYPCILSLPGRGEPATLPIDWWCGPRIPLPLNTTSGTDTNEAAPAAPSPETNASSPLSTLRIGHATRHGYIVIAPQWMLPQQTSYQYTEGEHARILAALRDGLRHFSVDTDRVFVSGHYDGATAAWDLAQAHPDIWAGAVMISPEADKFLVRYTDNLRASNSSPDEIPLGTYVVVGQADGTRTNSKMGTVLTRLLTSPAFDSLFVEYIGRGRERFQAELPRIMEWMEMSSHRRIRSPQAIEMTAMRPGDRFFYWLEAPQLAPTAAGNTYEFDPTRSVKFEAYRLDSTANGVRISSIPSLNRDAIVWLSPDMVDFRRPISIILRSERNTFNLTPDIGIMLEDARTRADRMHVYWQRVVLP